MKGKPLLLSAAWALLAVAPAPANDVWEAGSQGNDDQYTGAFNTPGQGVPQVHDLQGLSSAPDQDWFSYPVTFRHSYEARVSGGTTRWNQPNSGCTACASLDLVDQNGAILPTTKAAVGFGVAVRFIDPFGAFPGVDTRIRARGSSNVDFTTNDEYTIQIWDTTYFIPRWNNSGGQVTVLLLQNNNPSTTVTGNIYFYDTAGNLVSTQPLNVPSQGLQSLNTATVPALAGLGGSLAIAHNGGWGALSGKAVAIDSANGLTFDTLMVPIPE